MQKTSVLVSGRSFIETRNYIASVYFPKLKDAGVGAWIQLLSPKVKINEPHRFVMSKVLEKRLWLRVETREEQNGSTLIAVTVELSDFYMISGLIVSLLSCGIFALVFVPLIYWKYSRCGDYLQKAVALLRADLSATASP